ncbi:hypothetical protein [Nocardia suismassiliense]|uniref:hypothetical protein n=1 Tax=Nocardia suismassiliense TaxID=2077092 RepID=UPI00131F461A|nr:hypothetical protein [Nocardia suismassiliense]
MMPIRLTAVVSAAASLALALAGPACAEPVEAQRGPKRCTGATGSQVCLRVWDESGNLMVQPSGDYRDYAIEATDAKNRFGNTTSYRDPMTRANRIVDLGPLIAMTIRARGVARIGAPDSADRSEWLTVHWPLP